jgi:hypothetical protein
VKPIVPGNVLSAVGAAGAAMSCLTAESACRAVGVVAKTATRKEPVKAALAPDHRSPPRIR